MLINYKIELIVFRDYSFWTFLGLGTILSAARLPDAMWLSLKGDSKISKGGHGLNTIQVNLMW